MNNLLVLSETNLAPLERSEQINCSGGVGGEDAAFVAAIAVVSPLLSMYCGALVLAYYAGYGARLIYDASK